MVKARIRNLHKKEADWLKFQKLYRDQNNGEEFKPLAGELIIYDPDEHHSYARLKIGNGKTALHELDFIINSAIDTFLQEHNYYEELDGGKVANYGNNRN